MCSFTAFDRDSNWLDATYRGVLYLALITLQKHLVPRTLVVSAHPWLRWTSAHPA